MPFKLDEMLFATLNPVLTWKHRVIYYLRLTLHALNILQHVDTWICEARSVNYSVQFLPERWSLHTSHQGCNSAAWPSGHADIFEQRAVVTMAEDGKGAFVLIDSVSSSCGPAWWSQVAWSDPWHRSPRGPWCTRRDYQNCRCHPWSRHVSDTWLLWSLSSARRSWNTPGSWWRSSSQVVSGKGCRKAWSGGRARQTTG